MNVTLRGNNLRVEGAAQLSKLLSVNKCIKSLDIAGNNLGVEGIRKIVDALVHTVGRPVLAELSVGGNNAGTLTRVSHNS